METVHVFILIFFIIIPLIVFGIILLINEKNNRLYKELETEVLKELHFSGWNVVSYFDVTVIVKSRRSLETYDYIKYFKENRDMVDEASVIVAKKDNVTKHLREYLENNNHKEHSQYDRLVKQINIVLKNSYAFRIQVKYFSSAGNFLGEREISLIQSEINRLKDDPSLLMGKGEYSKFLKEQQKDALNQKQHSYYDSINKLIDYANNSRDSLIINDSKEQLDRLIANLFDRTVNSIKRIKTIDSEEWNVIRSFIAQISLDITEIVEKNRRIIEYYESSDFMKIKESCETLMSSQREFNEYIAEKVESISNLFGTRIVRNETFINDEYQYLRPYKKTITPFTAEVSATVFASAENNPLEYIVKYFYPDKSMYPEQIQKLHLLVEELETLREAKQIIERHKVEYQQYVHEVPDYIMINDEAGFYSRLGFANIDESVLVIEYKFSYTSGGGMAKRTFAVPMTETNIAELIRLLESKLTINAFTKEQRAMMTNKLRNYIKQRDNYTCCSCGNSVQIEPNLLLEIDHIIPVSKGGCTIEDNLQTLCWKCNRAKSSKIL